MDGRPNDVEFKIVGGGVCAVRQSIFRLVLFNDRQALPKKQQLLYFTEGRVVENIFRGDVLFFFFFLHFSHLAGPCDNNNNDDIPAGSAPYCGILFVGSATTPPPCHTRTSKMCNEVVSSRLDLQRKYCIIV